MPELKVSLAKTGELVAYENNAKIHTAEQVEQIKASILEFGFNDPIAVWRNEHGELEVVEGHGRLIAAREMGMPSVPTIDLSHMDDQQRRAYTHVHNQLTMNTDWDIDTLTEELANIGLDLEKYGFDDFMERIEIDDIDLGDEAVAEKFANELGEANNYVVLEFKTEGQWEQAQNAFDLERVCTGDKCPNVRRYGIGRVIDGGSVLKRLGYEG